MNKQLIYILASTSMMASAASYAGTAAQSLCIDVTNTARDFQFGTTQSFANTHASTSESSTIPKGSTGVFCHSPLTYNVNSNGRFDHEWQLADLQGNIVASFKTATSVVPKGSYNSWDLNENGNCGANPPYKEGVFLKKGSDISCGRVDLDVNKEMKAVYKVDTNEDIRFALTADPQPWRVSGDGKNKDAWYKINRNTVSALNAMYDQTPVDFTIMNGDLTEYGRKSQWNSFEEVYSNVKGPLLVGLGNHDIANNRNDCIEAALDGTSENSCAMYSMNRMEDKIKYNYARSPILEHFSKDWGGISDGHKVGSLSYSWDYKGVHFTQLQFKPYYKYTYGTWHGGRTYDYKSSLTWLAEDLRLAKIRGVKDIIINFHAYDYWNEATESEKKLFRSLLDTYNPIAIFVGHNHAFYQHKHYNHSVYGNTPVYVTSAAFKGEFHIVNYKAATGEIEIKEYSAPEGAQNITTLETYTEQKKDQKSMCLTKGQVGAAGAIYRGDFLPPSGHYINLSLSNNKDWVLDGDSKGNVYGHSQNAGNPYQLWSFEKAYGDYWPENNSWYNIKQMKTGRVLDSDSNGKVYTKYPNAGNAYQQWWVMPVQGNQLLLRNRATGRFLRMYGGKPQAYPGYDVFDDSKVFQITDGWSQQPRALIQYYKAKSDNSYQYDFSNTNYWSLLKEHNFVEERPCIAW
ncbi:metallophosphoesterase [Vibrio azureus]|nr:metallophosphoesterase [Vibrio azureus]